MRVTLKMPKVGDAADKVLVRELMVKRGDRIAEGNCAHAGRDRQSKRRSPIAYLPAQWSKCWSRSATKSRPERPHFAIEN